MKCSFHLHRLPGSLRWKGDGGVRVSVGSGWTRGGVCKVSTSHSASQETKYYLLFEEKALEVPTVQRGGGVQLVWNTRSGSINEKRGRRRRRRRREQNTQRMGLMRTTLWPQTGDVADLISLSDDKKELGSRVTICRFGSRVRMIWKTETEFTLKVSQRRIHPHG